MTKVTGASYVELRSEEVQELLTRPPKWLLRWGITVIFLLLILLLIGSWVVHYPDLVRASFKLTTANAPKAVLTRTEGKVVRLLAQEGQSVSAGTSLAYLESTARHEEVLRLSKELAKAWTVASRGDLEALERLHLSTYHQLGELQNAYQLFEQVEIQLGAYLANGFYSKKKVMLQQEITDFQTLATNLHEQQVLQRRDIKLAEEDYAIQQQLAEQKVIAPLDLKREESKLIARHLPYQQTASAIVNNLADQRTKQKEILELERQVTEERNKFLQALNTLQSAVDTWKAKYILTAPVNGRVYFTGTLQENQAVALNQELFYVAPPATNYYGELHIPQQNAGKVLVGQEVLIKFAGFPYHEFGFVRGQITTIADISLKDSVFLAKVTLPNGLRTSYGKSLSLKTGMAATADIVTADTRLLEKLFYQLRKAVNAR
ncbi:HlyD family efflux transporter periplasmic adaptor subunit [Spirosoma sp. RP8]|uniref:HlyD family efflux transporter periplasmic adaptor subunit n=1 Tax=Spirosoma liriopis TaxID=2937440 RepID=A0ABT0HTQ8_9BACT|nr:HlyD family efflux transporter periplasmic adaptor subunit [Spirosoma liriopis]MCK8495570.1 HlyD family efflux transporter periplasmic adaptor subunit [Spirosoma liriopis]